jgi:hypothetical protein
MSKMSRPHLLEKSGLVPRDGYGETAVIWAIAVTWTKMIDEYSMKTVMHIFVGGRGLLQVERNWRRCLLRVRLVRTIPRVNFIEYLVMPSWTD